eukprot:5390520-Lingulodinium_polyedra.AAC.1
MASCDGASMPSARAGELDGVCVCACMYVYIHTYMRMIMLMLVYMYMHMHIACVSGPNDVPPAHAYR